MPMAWAGSSSDLVDGAGVPWRSGREALPHQTHQDPTSAVSELRRRHELARTTGDRHTEWALLALLTRETAMTESVATPPLLALSEQALEAAQREGDKAAAFDLLVAIESTRLQQHLAPVNDDRIAQAASLAGELGDPVRQGWVGRLRGLASQHNGQAGEAIVQWERALPLFTHPLDRADLHLLLAQAALRSPSPQSADRAAAALDALAGLAGATTYPRSVDALALRARVLVRQGQATQAVATALQAASVARSVGLSSPWVRAQLALGHAYLAAGNPAMALDNLGAIPQGSMTPGEQLESFAGQALALSRLQAEGALELLRQGQALVASRFATDVEAILRFHEAAALVRQNLGDAGGALQDLHRAAALRASMADRAQDRLMQARVDAARGMATRATLHRQEQALLLTNAALMLALCVLVSLTAWHHQRRGRATRLARELEASNARLEAANAARNHHLASACHDLRQPAHVIGQLADALLHDPVRDPDAAQESLASIGQCSHTLNDMLDALLDLSVLEQGRYAPRIEPVPLGELLTAVDLRYRRAAQAKGLTWLVGSSQAVVQTDRHLLGRVLLHLASNAVRYSSVGGIQMLATVVGDTVQLEVADTGPGLPTDALLAPSPAETPTPARTLTSLGTGLALVREGCRLMGHELAVPLSSPRGSVVRVTMRKVDRARSGDDRDASSADAGQPPAMIAVVEADPAARQAKTEALVIAGLRAASFASLAALHEARETYPARGPAAVVLDLGDELMARGLERMQQWRQAFPDWQGPVLALTSDLRVDGLMRAAELGINLACKPLSNVKLTELLLALLHRTDLEWHGPPVGDAAAASATPDSPAVREVRLP